MMNTLKHTRFRCEFPDCKFETNDRQQIEYHHIIPVSQGGSNKRYNRIWLCRNHHSCIYIPNMQAGIHAKNNNTKIEIIRWLANTGYTRILEYRTFDGIEHLYEV